MDKNELNTLKVNRIISILSLVLFAALIFVLVFFYDKEISVFLYVLKCMGYFILYFFVSIIAHEFGHFIFGLINGFKPSTFQVLFFKFSYDERNHLHLNLTKIPFLGQCVMKVEGDIRKQKYRLYMYGGSIINLILFIIPAFLYCFFLISFNSSSEMLAIISIINAYLYLSNGIPMNLNNVYNDAMNLKLMSEYTEIRYAVLSSLKLERMKEMGLTIKEFDLTYIENHKRSIPYYNTLGYPFVLYKTMLSLSKKEEDAFKYVLHQYRKRNYLPRVYNLSLIVLILFYDIINDIDYRWILNSKEFSIIFKKIDEKDPINVINFTLIDYKSNKTEPDMAVKILNDEIPLIKDDKEISNVEKEFYINLTILAIEKIHEKEEMKKEAC